MSNSSRPRWIIFVVLGLILLLAIAGGAYLLSGGQLALPSLASGPTVLIVQPQGTVSLYSGQGVYLSTLGISENGFSHIDLSLNGEVIQSHQPNDATQNPYASQFVWFSSRVGPQTLSVVAYDANGAASEEVALIVNVYPHQVGQVDGEPENQDLGSAPVEEISVEEALQQLDAGEANPDAGAQPDAQGAEPAPQGDDQQPDQGQLPPLGNPDIDLGAPPVFNDDPPRLTAFEYDLNIVGNDVLASVASAAEDDLGVERVEYRLISNNGDIRIFSQLCGGHLSCETGGEVVLPPGEWALSAQAFDTSGQASEIEVLLAEVLGAAEQPPAAAEHDFEFNDPLADLDLDFPLGDLGQGFDLQDFLADRFGGNPDPIENQGNCATISLVVNSNSIELQGQVTCDLQTDAQHFLYVNAGQQILHQGDGGRSLSFPDWLDIERRHIAAGETFSAEINGLQCGVEYEYSFRVDIGSIVQGGQWDGHIGIGGTDAFVSQVIETAPCAANAISDIALEVHPSGNAAVEATWRVAPNGAWPVSIAEEGVVFYLMRFQDQTGELEVVDRFDLTREQLLAGRDFSLVDDRLECGTGYWYSVVVHLANQQQPRFATPIIQPSVFSEGIPCPGAELAGVSMNVSRHWTPGDDEYFLVEALFPANYAWPQGDNVQLKLQTLHVNENCSPPCDDGWGVDGILQVTDQVRGHEYAFEERVDPRCGSESYQLRFVVSVDGNNVDFGPITSIISAPCPPSPPQILSIQAASENCPNNVPHCILVTWELYEEPAREGYQTPAAYLVLERDSSAGENVLFRLVVGANTYLDANPTVMLPRDICSVPTMYRILAYDEFGRTAGASPLHIDGLTCDEPWDLLVESRR